MKNDIIKFLLGEDSFDGVWFGKNHPNEQGAFWWRKHLRQFVNENQALRIHDVMSSCEGNCGMNYCDDNGCIERKRILVEPTDLPEHGA